MKRLSKVLGICCVAVMMSATSPTSHDVRVQEASKEGLVVLSVTHRMYNLFWHFRRVGETRLSRFDTSLSRGTEDLRDGPALLVPLVLDEGDYEVVLFTAHATMPKMWKPPACWTPANFILVRFHVAGGKATYLGNIDLAMEETRDGGTYELSVSERSSTMEFLRGHYYQIAPEQWQTTLIEPREKDARGALQPKCSSPLTVKVPAEIP